MKEWKNPEIEILELTCTECGRNDHNPWGRNGRSGKNKNCNFNEDSGGSDCSFKWRLFK